MGRPKFAGAAALLISVTLFACYVPELRAAGGGSHGRTASKLRQFL